MKQNKVKGFTLIELIVVLAIFSIILYAATSLMQPVAKMMVLADIREQGSANVAQISKYLELNLSAAEYMYTANFVPSDGDRDDMVANYAKTYYEGILKNPSGYGTGKIHVTTIDNAQNGKISEYVYSYDFTPGSTPTLETTNEFAVNRAIYDEYHYSILPGVTKYSSATSDFHFSDFMVRPNDVRNTSFTINAFTIRNEGRPNEQRYDFTGTATVPLVNLANDTRMNGRPQGTYYVLHDELVKDSNGVNPGETGYIETHNDVIRDQAAVSNVIPAKPADTDTVTSFGNDPSQVYPYATGGMCFIYSFGSEMLTD